MKQDINACAFQMVAIAQQGGVQKEGAPMTAVLWPPKCVLLLSPLGAFSRNV